LDVFGPQKTYPKDQTNRRGQRESSDKTAQPELQEHLQDWLKVHRTPGWAMGWPLGPLMFGYTKVVFKK